MRKSDSALESVNIFVEAALTFERFTSSNWLNFSLAIIQKIDKAIHDSK
jgi:hypothetical protein